MTDLFRVCFLVPCMRVSNPSRPKFTPLRCRYLIKKKNKGKKEQGTEEERRMTG
jgi:hypothetical protein